MCTTGVTVFAEQLKSCLEQEMENMFLSEFLQQLISIVCKSLQSAVEGKGDVTQW